MADNVFSSAPNSSGRQFGAVAGIAKLLGGKGSSDYRQKSALQNESHVQNVQHSVVKHVLGETAADAAHRRTLAQNRQAHKLGVENRADVAAHIMGNVPAGHIATNISVPGGSATYKPLPEKAEAPSVPLESKTTKGPQFRARG
jgi:hypothetical protein